MNALMKNAKPLIEEPPPTEEDFKRTKQYSMVGYFDDTQDLAEYVYGHHERWDGTKYPRVGR